MNPRQVDHQWPEVDVAVVGMGWAGGIVATELARSGLSVVGLERGSSISPNDRQASRDEVRYSLRHPLTQDVSSESWTLRHDLDEPALPLRDVGSFRPGTGVGGSGLTWAGSCWRFTDHDFHLRTRLEERYGEEALPPDSTIQDWGITYAKLEPSYERFEKVAGVGGVAGRLAHGQNSNGNPFEEPRRSEYPLAPVSGGSGSSLFREAARQLGYHPYPQPGAVLSSLYTNPYGIERPACTRCGFCVSYPCHNGSRADVATAVLPVAEASGNLQIRTGANVVKIVHDDKRARSVLYIDEEGRLNEQPAALIILAAYTFNNIRLLLLSGLDRPYDPATGLGLVGKNYSYQLIVSGLGFFPGTKFDDSDGPSASGYCIDDFNGDNFDHSDLGFLGGGVIQCGTGLGQAISGIAVPEGGPKWGSAWKATIKEWFGSAIAVTAQAGIPAYREHCLDLDPTYDDAYGLPLIRITFDWRQNERKAAAYLASRIEGILTAMGARHIKIAKDLPTHYDVGTYQSTHNSGGAIMGSNPITSVVNTYCQMWRMPNVFVVGASAFPQNPGYGPTETVGALAFRAAEAIATRYVGREGLLD